MSIVFFFSFQHRVKAAKIQKWCGNRFGAGYATRLCHSAAGSMNKKKPVFFGGFSEIIFGLIRCFFWGHWLCFQMGG